MEFGFKATSTMEIFWQAEEMALVSSYSQMTSTIMATLNKIYSQGRASIFGIAVNIILASLSLGKNYGADCKVKFNTKVHLKTIEEMVLGPAIIRMERCTPVPGKMVKSMGMAS